MPLPHFASTAGAAGTALATGSIIAGLAVFGPEAMEEIEAGVGELEGEIFSSEGKGTISSFLDYIGQGLQVAQDWAEYIGIKVFEGMQYLASAAHNLVSETPPTKEYFADTLAWLREGEIYDIQVGAPRGAAGNLMSGTTSITEANIDKLTVTAEGTYQLNGAEISADKLYYADEASKEAALNKFAAGDKTHPFWAEKAAAFTGAAATGAAVNKARGKTWVETVKDVPPINLVAR